MKESKAFVDNLDNNLEKQQVLAGRDNKLGNLPQISFINPL